MKRGGVVSTLGSAEEAAWEVLQKGGSALKAALTGFFVAAGERPGVLFSPCSLIVAGLGAGARAYDGRARQPGLGTKRPRGFLPDEEIPRAARVAVPGSIAALAVACAYDSGTTLLSVARPGVQAAKRQGANGRADLLEYVATLGATALGHTPVRRAFLAEFGPAEQGLVGAPDLAPPAELDGPALGTESGGYRVPWSLDDTPPSPALGEGHVLLAADSQGQLVALAFRELDARVVLHPFETAVPLLAEPVLRGVSRTAPGAALPTFVDVGFERDESGALIEAWGRPRPSEGAKPLRLVRDPATKAVTSLR